MHGLVRAMRCPYVTRRVAVLWCLTCHSTVIVATARSSSTDILHGGLSTDKLLLTQALDALELAQPQKGFPSASLRGSSVTSSDKNDPRSQTPMWVSQEISSSANVQDAQQVQMREDQARIEAAQAAADEAAAEAIAADELRKADRAAARAKAAWARVRQAEAEALKVSAGFQAEANSLDSISLAAFAKSEDVFMKKGDAVSSDLRQAPADVAVLDQPTTTLANFTSDSDGCNHNMFIPCPAQRVLTLDYRVQIGSAFLEWVGLFAVWAASLYALTYICDCGAFFLCICQTVSCGAILVIVLSLANGWLHGQGQA